ncbi:MAG: hypothetical protein DI539_13275 [Flavobacterium psychrophilum]|nr:MAG: hypothetical protein DI539_13275 [Flavobacterium psychrophilum]
MIETRIFSAATCTQLLNYRTDEGIRSRYNEEMFDFSDAIWLRDTVKLDMNLDEVDGFRPIPGGDAQNSIKLFNALKHLDLVQANDKRLWVTLAHTLFYNYTRQRWGIDEESSDDTIKDRFHFEGAALRQRNQHSIARLWWAARLTWDPKQSDPFELTKLLWEKQDFYQNLIDRRFSTYQGALKGFLTFYAKNKHLDMKQDMRKLFKGLNALGGVRVLSLMHEQEVERECFKKCVSRKLSNFKLIQYGKAKL